MRRGVGARPATRTPCRRGAPDGVGARQTHATAVAGGQAVDVPVHQVVQLVYEAEDDACGPGGRRGTAVTRMPPPSTAIRIRAVPRTQNEGRVAHPTRRGQLAQIAVHLDGAEDQQLRTAPGPLRRATDRDTRQTWDASGKATAHLEDIPRDRLRRVEVRIDEDGLALEAKKATAETMRRQQAHDTPRHDMITPPANRFILRHSDNPGVTVHSMVMVSRRKMP